MLTFMDFFIIILFVTILFSIYKVFKPENAEINSIIATNTANKKIIKSIIKQANKKISKNLLNTIVTESIETKAEKLSKIDKEFLPQSFMENSKVLFSDILKAFEKKDRETLKQYVSPNVYKVFESNIEELEKKKQKINTEIIRFKKIMIKDININKKIADIIVEFTTEQTIVLKDDNNKIILGDDNQIETIVDKWQFTRNYNVKNNKWLLSNTIG